MLWNERNLRQPPTITFKPSNTDLDLNKLKNALQDGISHFKDNKILTNELAILSRILYRMKMKFRSAKDFKLLEKLRRCLDLFYEAKLAGYLKNLLHMVPSEYRNSTYLPSKSMLHYVLVRLQGLVKLMERTYDTCIIVASELNSRLYIGHFWKLFFILFALVSRITVLVKFNTRFLCELYGKLLPHCNKLQIVGSSWLPENYILPTDLRSWLGVPWVYEEEFVDLTFEPNNSIVDFFNLVDDDEDDVLFCDEYILLDDEDKTIMNDFKKLPPIKETLNHNRMRGFSICEEDIGEDIADLAKSTHLSNELEIIEEDVELPLQQPKVQIELEDSGEEINNPLEDSSVIALSDSPRSSVITVDDTIIHQKSTGKKKKKKHKVEADNKNQRLTSKPTKRKLSFNEENSLRKQLLLGKKLKRKKQMTENKVKPENMPGKDLITDDSVIYLDDQPSLVQGSSKQSCKTTPNKENGIDSKNQPVFLSLDVTREKENVGRSKLTNVLAASGNQFNESPNMKHGKKGRYWQTGDQLKLAKSSKKNFKSKKSTKKRKNKRRA